MQENVLEALTVVDVMREMGVSIRTLQLAFQDTRNNAPMAFLRGARMARAREALLRGDASTTVTQVALRHGFLILAGSARPTGPRSARAL